ncbi:hypothetical protein KIF59_06845 [Enterobacter cloacae subsp. cloacae]|nr:hypothetical protein [Enterobacter cloacae subsp. cloacae]
MCREYDLILTMENAIFTAMRNRTGDARQSDAVWSLGKREREIPDPYRKKP